MELQYAPPAKNPSRVIPVILAGLLTTALALVGVYLLDAKADFNIMGWHLNYVIPGGAIAVGLVASSGYGLASYFTGLKIRKGLLLLILLLQLCAYFASQYVAFASQGPLYLRGTTHRVSFPEYFDLVARNFAWKDEHSDKPGEALGGAGYFFIALEILGFVGGSLIVPGALMKHPYCELCQIYMKNKKLGTIAASIRHRKVKKGDGAGQLAYTNEQKQAYELGQAKVNQLAQLAAAGDVAGFNQNVASIAPLSKAARKLPSRMTVTLVRCRGCNSGYLDVVLLTGQGKQIKRTPLARIDLSPDFVAAYTHPFGSVAQVAPVKTQSI